MKGSVYFSRANVSIPNKSTLSSFLCHAPLPHYGSKKIGSFKQIGNQKEKVLVSFTVNTFLVTGNWKSNLFIRKYCGNKRLGFSIVQRHGWLSFLLLFISCLISLRDCSMSMLISPDFTLATSLKLVEKL